MWTGESKVVEREGGEEGKSTTSNPRLPGWDPYLIQGHVPDGCAIDFEDPVSHVDGILHIWAHAAWVHSVGTE